MDESATDGGTPTAVVAGLLLDWNRYTWLDIEWEKVLAPTGMKIVHMKKIGKWGYLKEMSIAERRDVFEKLVQIINENKGWSIAATLSPEDHEKHFAWLGAQGWGLYATCFLVAVVQQGKQLEYEKYPYDVPYTLDDGNSHKDELKEVHGYIVNQLKNDFRTHCGSLNFCDDAKVRALQAADVISWAVHRRCNGKPLRPELEPLEGIILPGHLEQSFKSDWMAEVSDALRAKRTLREQEAMLDQASSSPDAI